MTHDTEDGEPNPEFGGAFGLGPRETVADMLRRAREDFGQDVRSVASILRIRPAYLEAIESGEFDLLPGTTYAVGFLRTYAEYLGLDGEDMVERFKAETQAAERHSELVFPEPVAEGRIPGGAIILVSVALLAVAYGGWFYLSQQGRTVVDLIPAWPTDTRTADPEMADTGDSPVAAEPAAEAAAKTTDEPAAEKPAAVATATAQASTAEVASPAPEAAAPSEPNVAPEPAPVTEIPAQDDPAPAARVSSSTRAPMASQSVTEQPAPVDEPATLSSLIDPSMAIPAPPSETVIIPDDRSPRVYGGSNDSSRIVIRAVQDSWVQVRDSQDAILLTRVLRAGDSYRVPNVDGLTLLTGNAGGIELEVDGVRLPPAGPPGSVRRSISLNPSQLLSGHTDNR